jgi:ribosome maturation factor RimP
MNSMLLNKITELVNGIIVINSLTCIESEWDPSDKTLRIYIDRTDGKVLNIDDCVSVSRQLNISEELDNMVDGAYTLEVSSPGIERHRNKTLERESNI